MNNENAMTIDEFARAGDVVVSTVRLYQNRGLLPAPTKRGRVGYYDSRHLGRLRLIAKLQERGFSLAGIRELLHGMEHGASLQAVLGLDGEPSTWTPEVPQRLSLAELAEALPGVALTPEVVARVVGLGLVEFVEGGGDVVVRSPSFLRIGSQLAALGVPSEVILDQYEALRDDAERISARFTAVFRTHMWEPFLGAGMPAERIASMVEALEQLGPLAEDVVVTSLRHSLQEFAEAFIEAEADRLGVDIPRPGQRGSMA